MEINHGKVYQSKLKNAGHTYGAVYYGKLLYSLYTREIKLRDTTVLGTWFLTRTRCKR